MGLYDSQIRQRIKNDEESLTGAFVKLSGVVMGAVPALDLAESEKTRSAIEEILKYYKIKAKDLPERLTKLNDQLDYLLRPAGIMKRPVKLTALWYKNAVGAHLVTLKDSGDVVALIPRKLSGYDYFDFRQGRRVKVNKQAAANIEEDAYCFYSPLPQREITPRDFTRYFMGTLSGRDFVMLGVCMLAVTLTGMLTPYITHQLFTGAVYGGNTEILLPAAALLTGAAVSGMLFGVSKALILTRIQARSSVMTQAAVVMRVLSLPASFFQQYSAGETAQRASNAKRLCVVIAQTVLSISFTPVFALLYIGQIFIYAPALVVPAVFIILITLGATLLTAFAQLRLSKKMMDAGAAEQGLVFSLISGVPKIKLTGSERRAFAKWADVYARRGKLQYAPPALVKYSAPIMTFISLSGIIILYSKAAAAQVGVAEYMAFASAYGMLSGAFLALVSAAVGIANAAQIMRSMEPFFKACPELSENKEMVTGLSGGIELNNISFRYSDTMPLVLDDLSLRIRPGQYVAIAGKTGCGKSTLLRLLLGFEKPQKGAVYYDGKDLSALDVKSLRKNIGVVTQDGKLFQGDIYSNIVISAPWLTMDDAWEAAEAAGIAEDIKGMPMGMQTLISEGSGGVSGGQKQRLMIARAVAPKPKILFFDEATSALDNITQKIVSDNLDKLKCTRIIIAHRLSTIKNCDRIIVLEDGKIAEDGGFDELTQKGGFFADLVRRQMIADADKSNADKVP